LLEITDDNEVLLIASEVYMSFKTKLIPNEGLFL